ncbi:MAG: beta-ketoacyl synthase N-terminal-like domain-containing protein [Frisingicoccus sp.]
MKERVVVTGLGAITPIGNNIEEFWNGIKAGKTGFGKIRAFDTTNFKTSLAAEVEDFVQIIWINGGLPDGDVLSVCSGGFEGGHRKCRTGHGKEDPFV